MTVIGRDDKVTKKDLCEECSKSEPGAKGIQLDDLLSILGSGRSEAAMELDLLKAALGENTKYPIEAYVFVRETCFGIQVSAGAFLEGIRKAALIKFGKRAKAALAEWKIFRTEDFGEIVFEMIDSGLLRGTREDSRENFQNRFNFDEAFPES